MGETQNTNTTPAPPCRKQGSFQSIGGSPHQSTPYLHVRAEP